MDVDFSASIIHILNKAFFLAKEEKFTEVNDALFLKILLEEGAIFSSLVHDFETKLPSYKEKLSEEIKKTPRFIQDIGEPKPSASLQQLLFKAEKIKKQLKDSYTSEPHFLPPFRKIWAN